MNTVVAWSAILSAIWWGLQLGFVLTFFRAGQPFGALSDLSNALNALFLIPVVLFFHFRAFPAGRAVSLFATVIGSLGILAIASSSLLIMFGRISFGASLPPIMAGFAAIGVWVLMQTLALPSQTALPGHLSWLGIIVGIGLAAIGLLFFWGDVSEAWATGRLLASPAIYPVGAAIAVGYLSLPIWLVMLGRHLLEG